MFLLYLSVNLSDVITDVDDKAKKITIIADVNTDGNTKHVLEDYSLLQHLYMNASYIPQTSVPLPMGVITTSGTRQYNCLCKFRGKYRMVSK